MFIFNQKYSDYKFTIQKFYRNRLYYGKTYQMTRKNILTCIGKEDFYNRQTGKTVSEF